MPEEIPIDTEVMVIVFVAVMSNTFPELPLPPRTGVVSAPETYVPAFSTDVPPGHIVAGVAVGTGSEGSAFTITVI